MTSPLPEWAYAAALASLPLQTPNRLRQLLARDDASQLWELIRSGEQCPVPMDDEVWRAWSACRLSFVEDVAAACEASSMRVVSFRDSTYPETLKGDPHAPAVLFHRGDLSVLAQRRVGIIGTRRATQSGRFFARNLAEQLSSASVCVVSGLARGIDVESHVGALSGLDVGGAAPVAVVASGLDIVYPPEHSAIWNRMGSDALILSESPPGTKPEPHRFPMRNRILAALSEVLVVVESRASGGSMITVREAMSRDVTVMAVPGSPNLPSSEGTNVLLRDGCAPVTDADDVLVALGLDTRRTGGWHDARERPTNEEQKMLDVIRREPRSLDAIALMTSSSIIDAAVSMGRLEAKGWVAQTNGWWEALIG